MFIYVVCKGCIHEGGEVVSASTNLLRAWLDARTVLKDMRDWYMRCGIKDIQRLKGWMYWQIGSDYVRIIRHRDLG